MRSFRPRLVTKTKKASMRFNVGRGIIATGCLRIDLGAVFIRDFLRVEGMRMRVV